MSNLGLERYLAEIAGPRSSIAHRRSATVTCWSRCSTQNCNVGGEASGHIILSDYATTGDGLVAALQVIAVVKKLGRPASEVCRRFEPLPQIMRNVRYKKGKPLEDAGVVRAIKDGEQRLKGQGRLVIRPSGTETVIRVMGEGDDKSLVEDVVDGIAAAVADAAA